jgi:ElaB/YqjD/DUF883 family membrane-anchored ribosome-binding protein
MTSPTSPQHNPAPDPVSASIEGGPAYEDDVVTTPPPVAGPGSDLSSGSGESRSEAGRADQAHQEASAVADDAKKGGRQVADAAKQEASSVKDTVGDQTRQLLDQTRSELAGQAGTQQHRLADGLRALGNELGSMADGSQEQGIATDLARQASQQSEDLAEWLENREPADLLGEVRGYARRHPGTFIAVAAAIGLVAGRLTRGLSGGSDGNGGSAASTQATSAPPPAVGAAPVGAPPATAPTTTPPGAVPAADPYAGSQVGGGVEGRPAGHIDPSVAGTPGRPR